MSYSKLRGRIREKYGTQAAFAEDMGLNYTTLSNKLSGKTEWTRAEIERACNRLEIPAQEIPLYFFSFNS